jgi:hypothetical protein
MIRTLALVFVLALTLPALAADLAEDATVASVLEAAKGSKVTLRLVAGDEMTGKVTFVGTGVVKLVELSGREFFEAVVDLEDVVAVISRTPGAGQ